MRESLSVYHSRSAKRAVKFGKGGGPIELGNVFNALSIFDNISAIICASY